MAPTNINYNTSNSNTMPPYMHNQQTQQINNMPNPNNMQMASQEFAIGQQYMDINNPQHNYIKAINHFQKSSLLGNQNAKFLYGYGLFVSGYGYIKTKCASTK